MNGLQMCPVMDSRIFAITRQGLVALALAVGALWTCVVLEAATRRQSVHDTAASLETMARLRHLTGSQSVGVHYPAARSDACLPCTGRPLLLLINLYRIPVRARHRSGRERPVLFVWEQFEPRHCRWRCRSSQSWRWVLPPEHSAPAPAASPYTTVKGTDHESGPRAPARFRSRPMRARIRRSDSAT